MPELRTMRTKMKGMRHFDTVSLFAQTAGGPEHVTHAHTAQALG